MNAPFAGPARTEIKIQPSPRYGANVFVNRNGGITIEQASECFEEACRMVFHPEEAVPLAEAIIEVARAAREMIEEEQEASDGNQ